VPTFSEGLRPDEFAVLALGAVEARAGANRASVEVEVCNEGADPVAGVVVAVLAQARVVASTTVGVLPGGVARATLSWPWRDGSQSVTVVVDPDRVLTMEPRTACTRTVSVQRAATATATATAAVAAAAPELHRWVSLGPALIRSGLGAVGRLHHIVIRPDRPATMLVAGGGGSGSGVWRTEDGGTTWEPVTDAFGTPNVKALAMDPGDPARVYAASTRGLLVTTNGGDSWSQVADNAALGMTGADGVLVVDPADPRRLYLANARGVSRSTDRGATWTVVLAAGQGTDLITAVAAGGLLAAIRNDGDLAQTGVWASADSGGSWRRLTGCPGGRLPEITGPTGIRLARSGSTVFASFKTGTDWTLYRTTGVGCSIGGRPESMWQRGWRPDGTAGGQPIFRRLWKYLCADPTDPDFVYLGGTDMWVSSNRGDTFTRITEPHVDHQGFAVHPTQPRTVFTVSDGGVYRSTSRGAAGSWQFLGQGVRNTELYDLADAATDPDLLIGGTQDNGTIRWDRPSQTWRWVRGGDGATVAIDPENESVMYSMGQYADSISRSTDGGENWTGISASLPAGQCFNLHYQVHPGDRNLLLASCTSLWRFRIGSAAWAAIFTPPGGTVVRSAVRVRDDLYLAGTSLGALYAGAGGTGFTEVLRNPFGGGGINDILIDPDDDETIWLAHGGTGTGRVLRTSRDGDAVDVTGTLPAGLSVRTLAADRLNPGFLYAGTDRGVYRARIAGGAWTWLKYGTGLPDPDVRALRVHPRTGVMRAATLGRGVWEILTGPPLGSILAETGRVTMVRAHDTGTGFGSGGDRLDADAVVRLDSRPAYSFGLQLRPGPAAGAAAAMFALLRGAFRRNEPVRVEYTRTGLRSGMIIRAIRE
jgi:hypothetical protein